MLHFHDYKPMDLIFTQVLDDGTNIHIDANLLRKWCIRTIPSFHTIEVNPKIARSFVDNNIVSLDRVRELASRPHDAVMPIIICRDTDTYDFFVDGHHRYVLHYMARIPDIVAHILLRSEWEPFIIHGVPALTREELLSSPNLKRHY